MATLYVKKDGSGTHTDIQSAVYDASPGDIIQISAETYQENVDLYKGVTLEGVSKETSIIEGSLETAVVRSFTCALGSTTLTMSGGTSGLKKGRLITGTGIPANARIADVQANSITISAATTAARTSATNATMPIMDATVRVRGSGGSLKKIKIVGFDNSSPSTEMAAVYYRNVASGSAAASSQLMENCWVVANGDYAILADSGVAVGNITVNNCYISGKTFTGSTPASGDQFTVPNVPRQLVVFQSVNLPITFTNNLIEGVTGGVTAAGANQYNTAVTIDAPGSIITNNVIRGTHGYGYALRVRGYGSTVSGNKNYSLTSATQNANYYVLPSWAAGASYAQDAVVFTSSKYWKAKQAHTSASANSPTSASSATYWQEITLTEVNATAGMGVSQKTIGSNITIEALLVNPAQPVAGGSYQASMDKNQLSALSAVSSSVQFSNQANWAQVSYIYKNTANSKRMMASFKGNYESSATSSMKLRGAVAGDSYQLVKIIVRDSSRNLLVIKRSEIPEVSSLDFTVS